jgi:hypothetical protein
MFGLKSHRNTFAGKLLKSVGICSLLSILVSCAGVTSNRSNPGTNPPTGPTGPTSPISGVSARSVLSTSVDIVWTTSMASNSQVNYGTTASYGQRTALDSTMVTSHSESVTGLTPSTLYHYQVQSTGSSGNAAASGDFTFTTAAPLQSGVSLTSLAASMQPGTWAVLNTSNFNASNWPGSGVMHPYGSTSIGAGSILEYMDKGVWNPINNTVMVLGSADLHSHPASCPNYSDAFVRYVDATNSWDASLPDPCPTYDNAFASVGGMGHNYEHIAIDPATGNVFHRQYDSGKVMEFSHATQAWSQLPVFIGTVANGGTCGSTCPQVAGSLMYFPDRNSLVFIDGDWGVYECTFTGSNTNGTPCSSWKQIAWTFASGGTPKLNGIQSYNQQGTYSSLCQCLLMGWGIGTGTSFYAYSANGTFSSQRTSPITMGLPGSGSGTILTTDPASGMVLVWTSSTPSQEWQYNPATNVWTNTGIAAPIFPGPEGGVDETVAIPISTYGVIMFAQQGSALGGTGKVYLYKHN